MKQKCLGSDSTNKPQNFELGRVNSCSSLPTRQRHNPPGPLPFNNCERQGPRQPSVLGNALRRWWVEGGGEVVSIKERHQVNSASTQLTIALDPNINTSPLPPRPTPHPQPQQPQPPLTFGYPSFALPCVFARHSWHLRAPSSPFPAPQQEEHQNPDAVFTLGLHCMHCFAFAPALRHALQSEAPVLKAALAAMQV